eukprot:3245206-Amphidinium_carterae.1
MGNERDVREVDDMLEEVTNGTCSLLADIHGNVECVMPRAALRVRNWEGCVLAVLGGLGSRNQKWYHHSRQTRPWKRKALEEKN